ncbi:MAG TPA: Ig-like domain-containing protein [Gemmatimonadaceae bacterium]
MQTRTPLVLVAAAVAALACGGSKESNTSPPPTDTTGTSPSGLNIAVDSAFSNRTAVVATALPAEVHVTKAGQPQSGVVVNWNIITGGGKVASPTSTTDANGLAATTWTIGDTVRLNTLSASITGTASSTMLVQGVADAPTVVTNASADSSAVVAGSNLVLTVRVADKFGNAVANVPVTWTATGGALTVSSSQTGPSGRSEAVFSTNPAAQSYGITATVAGVGAATFKVVGM